MSLSESMGRGFATPPEEEYDFTLEFNVEELVGDNHPAGAFERAFAAQAEVKEENDPNFDPNAIEFIRIDPHRDERMYIRHHRDYTTIIIGIALDDLDEIDRMFVKLTFEELKHRSRLPYYCNSSPMVVHAKVEPPPEIHHLEEVELDSSRCRAYITFLLQPRLIVTKEQRDYIISQRMIFRDYLQYHIKYTEGFLNMWMRRRFNDHIKSLDRTSKDYVPPARLPSRFRRAE
ncbi:hypothetical protein BGZ47_001350 [Haplosporangium gracile]|nr:hypothetical protein BGZ47_001350 [Haplosporangium gracile]